MANILDTLFLLFYAFRVTPDIHGSARNKNHFFHWIFMLQFTPLIRSDKRYPFFLPGLAM